MPGWHKATQQWVRDGRLVVLGITQEQHPDRCRLFAQWQKFDWPILHDPINVLGSRVVPIVIAIDEHGIVRSTRPSPATLERDFLDRKFPPPDGKRAAPMKPRPADLDALRQTAKRLDTSKAWRRLGDALVLWKRSEQINEAIDAYSRAIKKVPDDGNALFRLGVCYRMRFESPDHQTGDFQRAVVHWERALVIDPNQYIWRRRIQQYGPRLKKPYSFYDWIHRATKEIAARGETPVALKVRPTGSEFAQPERRFTVDRGDDKSPDAEGRINRDVRDLISTEVAVVPARVRPGSTARVHLTFRPNERLKAKWNNESAPLRLWINAPSGSQVDRRLLSAPQPKSAESGEVRHLDFEVKVPDDARGEIKLKAYALYYVCEGASGTCLFLRRDVTVSIRVAAR